MALSKEDHGDIKQAYGKALANKVSKVSRDHRDGGRQHASKVARSIKKTGRYEMPDSRKKQLYAAWAKADPSHPSASEWREKSK